MGLADLFVALLVGIVANILTVPILGWLNIQKPFSSYIPPMLSLIVIVVGVVGLIRTWPKSASDDAASAQNQPIMTAAPSPVSSEHFTGGSAFDIRVGKGGVVNGVHLEDDDLHVRDPHGTGVKIDARDGGTVENVTSHRTRVTIGGDPPPLDPLIAKPQLIRMLRNRLPMANNPQKVAAEIDKLDALQPKTQAFGIQILNVFSGENAYTESLYRNQIFQRLLASTAQPDPTH